MSQSIYCCLDFVNLFAWNRVKSCYPLESATCMKIDFKPPKMTPIFPKSKIIQKPQFPPTLLANFWYLTITKLVSDGKWQYLGLAPPLKTFHISEHSENASYWAISCATITLQLLHFFGQWPFTRQSSIIIFLISLIFRRWNSRKNTIGKLILSEKKILFPFEFWAKKLSSFLLCRNGIFYNCILPAKKWRNIIENGSIFLAFALHKSNIALKENWNKSSIHLLHYFFTFAHYTPWANIWKHPLLWLKNVFCKFYYKSTSFLCSKK